MLDSKKGIGEVESTKKREKSYAERIVDLVNLIENEQLLKRIYNLAEYLYIYK